MTCFSTPTGSKVLLWVFLWIARQYHSIWHAWLMQAGLWAAEGKFLYCHHRLCLKPSLLTLEQQTVSDSKETNEVWIMHGLGTLGILKLPWWCTIIPPCPTHRHNFMHRHTHTDPHTELDWPSTNTQEVSVVSWPVPCSVYEQRYCASSPPPTFNISSLLPITLYLAVFVFIGTIGSSRRSQFTTPGPWQNTCAVWFWLPRNSAESVCMDKKKECTN